jgi:hypothetical protein
MYTIRNWRGKFINKLIKNLELKSYLELGISVGECWKEIEFENKIGIDNWVQIEDNRIIQSTTDDYFNSLQDSDRFDLVFIDADHEKNQVFKDFCNSYNHLSDNGIILLHDINPIDESNIDPTRLGNAYEFWIDLVDKYEDNCKVFVAFADEMEGSVGIFFKKGSNFNRDLFGEILHTYSDLNSNREKYIKNIQVTENQIEEIANGK